jgi:hypothetical protein
MRMRVLQWESRRRSFLRRLSRRDALGSRPRRNITTNVRGCSHGLEGLSGVLVSLCGQCQMPSVDSGGMDSVVHSGLKQCRKMPRISLSIYDSLSRGNFHCRP